MNTHPSTALRVLELLLPNRVNSSVVLALTAVNIDGGREIGGAAVTYPLIYAIFRTMQRTIDFITRSIHGRDEPSQGTYLRYASMLPQCSHGL